MPYAAPNTGEAGAAGPSDREDRLIATFVELADTLVESYDVSDLLHTLSARCVEIFPVDEAGIMLLDADGVLRPMASSSEDAFAMDLLEVQKEVGPCIEALETGEPVSVSDIQAESERWPDYAAKASKFGLKSIDAIPLRLRDETVGALNLFRLESGGSSSQDLDAMRALADVATISILQARAIEDAEDTAGHLQIALDSRVTIEQAKGIVTENLEIEMTEGFERLRRYARNNNLKLTKVAQRVVDGALRPGDLD